MKMDTVNNRESMAADNMENEMLGEQLYRHESQKLLEAITAELCGEKEPGSQVVLDTHLKRYYEFLCTKYENKASQMRGLLPFQLRTHLLLSLQSDLIKLLVEVDTN